MSGVAVDTRSLPLDISDNFLGDVISPVNLQPNHSTPEMPNPPNREFSYEKVVNGNISVGTEKQTRNSGGNIVDKMAKSVPVVQMLQRSKMLCEPDGRAFPIDPHKDLSGKQSGDNCAISTPHVSIKAFSAGNGGAGSDSKDGKKR
ncbi:hypothetical protein L1887_25627 [Cichorium endivia]|nr:hypothetical protein L1887_25627 [Cichorium endivia]